MPTSLILIEGTDGTGKSLFIESLHKQIHSLGLGSTLNLAFPSRSVPIRSQDHPTSKILFFLDDFNTTFRDLKCFSKDFIVCDRSFLSTLVYQGFRGDYSLSKGRFYDSILTVGENTFFNHIDIDHVHTVLLTCPTEITQERIQQRDSDKDELDKMEGHQQEMRLDTLATRYEIVLSDLKARWNQTKPFRPDPVADTSPHFHSLDTDENTSEQLAEKFIESAIGN